jgi:hypothetical protein
MMKIKNQEDFWSGLMFIAFGVAAVVLSSGYPMGSPMRMGPGYFPRALGIITAILGLIIAFSALKVKGPKVKPFGWRGIIMLAAGFLFFGWAIEHLGFVPALFGMILCHAMAGKAFKPVEVMVLTLVLIIGSVALFIYGLDLPLPLFRWR